MPQLNIRSGWQSSPPTLDNVPLPIPPQNRRGIWKKGLDVAAGASR